MEQSISADFFIDMDLIELKLVPLDTLVKEIESRCSSFVAAYETYDNHKKHSMFYYGKGTWYDSCRLTNILNNDVLNNWNGEMQTLQRLNEEEED